MGQTGSLAASKLLDILSADNGVPAIANEELRFASANVAAEVADKATGAKYPAFHVYCDRIVNDGREKFRVMSGEVRMVVEVRASRDRLDGLEPELEKYVDAVMAVLDQNRGDWEDGYFYPGGYEVSFGPVKYGGRNFLQIAKVGLSVMVGR